MSAVEVLGLNDRKIAAEKQMFVLSIIAYVIVGTLAGILGGLLGVGGGIVSVPALYFIFQFLGYPSLDLMYLAIGTSLAAMVLNTLASTWAHNQRANVLWQTFKKMAPGLFIGSIVGACFAKWLSGIFLEVFFGIFLCFLAFCFWKKHPLQQEPHRLPKTIFLWMWSIAIGGISNILGIGGGTLIVPFLTACRVPAKNAIGTSAACSLLITCIGTCSYLFLGMGQLLPFSKNIGYINVPAFLIVGIVSFLVAPFGAYLTQIMPVTKIRKIFAFVLLLTGILMMI